MEKRKKQICILPAAVLLASVIAAAVYLGGAGSIKTMRADRVSAAIADYFSEDMQREFLTTEQVDLLITSVKASNIKGLDDDAYAELEQHLYGGSPIMRIILEEENIVKWMIYYRETDASDNWPGMVLISTGDHHWKSEDLQLIEEIEKLFEAMAGRNAVLAEYNSPDLLTCDTLPFLKREFRVEPYVTGEDNDEFHKGVIYKNDGGEMTEDIYLRICGNGTYAFENGNFTVAGNKDANRVYENVRLTEDYYPEGGEIPVSSSDLQRGIAAVIDAPYTEYRILSESTEPGEYRLYEIWREGKNGDGNLWEYWLGYFEEECRHIFHVGTDYEVTERYEITETVTLLERKTMKMPNGIITAFSLWDEEQGKEFPLHTGGYSDFLEVTDEKHLVFYLHGQNPISESYHGFPYLIHLTWTDLGTDEPFEEVREEICFSMDADNLVGKDADCMISDIRITEDGIELTSAEDPENPMDFYAAYSDAALTRITFDEKQQALCLHMSSRVKVDESVAEHLQVPESHRYIENIAVEQNGEGTDILLYLSDKVKGYYGETVSDGVSNPVLKLRFAEK